MDKTYKAKRNLSVKNDMNNKPRQSKFLKKTEDETISSLQGSIVEIDVQSEKLRLKKQFGIMDGMAVTVGLMVGSGIFISPQVVLGYAGSPGLTLIIWAVGGLYALLGSLTTAEIGIHIPVSGVSYSYLCELYNPYFGVLYLCHYLLLMRPSINAIKLVIFGRYILKPLYGDCEIPQLAILTTSSTMAFFIVLLNCMKVKVIARGQSLMSFLTVMTLIFIICMGVYHCLTGGSLENLHEPFKDSCTGLTCFVMAFYGSAFSYIGWNALNFITEEIHNPKKTLPTVSILSTSLVTTVYVLVNLTYLTILNKSEATSTQAIAITLAMKLSIFGGWITSILIGLTACSSYNTAHLVGSRMAFVGARNKHIPKCLSFINIKYVSPIVAVIFTSVPTVLYSWLFEVHYLLNNSTFTILAFEFILSAGYVKHRIKLSNVKQDNKFKVPLAIHVIYCTLLFTLTLIPLVTNFVASASFFCVLTACFTIYYHVFVKGRFSPEWLKNASSRINDMIQKLLYCAPEEMFN